MAHRGQHSQFLAIYARRFPSNLLLPHALALSARHFLVQEKVPTSTSMRSVRLETTVLTLLVTRVTRFTFYSIVGADIQPILTLIDASDVARAAD